MKIREPSIFVEKMNPERAREFYEAVLESLDELRAKEFIDDTEVTLEAVRQWQEQTEELWKNDQEYHFQIVEATSNQVVGWGFLNNVRRRYQMANLGYFVRTSRVGEGIATAAARLIAKYGFEKLGFQRIEIVVEVDHSPSLRIAEKLGALREGLLRNRLQVHGSPHDAYMHSLIPSDYGLTKTA
jgi:RimJ/RimL family protein N-acetyltransferase